MINYLLQRHLKLLQKNDSKNSRSNGGLTGNGVADRITKVSKPPAQNKSETNEGEILQNRERKLLMM